MGEYIMNYSGTLGHGSGSVVSGGTFAITSTVSDKFKCNGEGVYLEIVEFTFSGGDADGCDEETVSGAGAVEASSLIVSSDGKFVMRENDETTTGSFSGTSSGNTVTLGNMPVKVINAGQEIVKAE